MNKRFDWTSYSTEQTILLNGIVLWENKQKAGKWTIILKRTKSFFWTIEKKLIGLFTNDEWTKWKKSWNNQSLSRLQMPNAII